LVRFNERIRINGEPISDQDVIASHEAVKKAVSGVREPTFFEYTTAMAFYYFALNGVDWGVIETGMGGRLDATNVITPVVSVISNVSLEHQAYLGKTLSQIAFEKSGIIKHEIPAVSGIRQPGALSVIQKIALEKGSPLFRLGKDFRFRRNRNSTFTYFGIKETWTDMKSSLIGDYQTENASLSLAACEVLNSTGVPLSLETIRTGMAQTRWPGRLEIVSKKPLVVLDGAHNLMAAKNLARFLLKNMKGRKITLVIGILNDKPFKKMLDLLIPTAHQVILTQAEIDRALPPEILLKEAGKSHSRIKVVKNVEEAFCYALQTTEPDDAICVAGSLYVVGEVKRAIEKNSSLLPKSDDGREISD
jgi:dihydrofolate synthase/folylpolyglutamate synthase